MNKRAGEKADWVLWINANCCGTFHPVTMESSNTQTHVDGYSERDLKICALMIEFYHQSRDEMSKTWKKGAISRFICSNFPFTWVILLPKWCIKIHIFICMKETTGPLYRSQQFQDLAKANRAFKLEPCKAWFLYSVWFKQTWKKSCAASVWKSNY